MLASDKMVDAFLLKLILSFLVGGIWVAFATVLAEKFGTKLGGVIAGLPSTILLGLFFIGWTQTPSIAAQSAGIVPLAMGIYCLFIVAYILLYKLSFYLAISASTAIWLILTLSFVLLNLTSLVHSLTIFAVLLVFSYYILEKKLCIKSENKIYVRYTLPKLLFRGIISGTIVAFAAIMAKIGGPLLGGIFASFPAVSLSTMAITHFAYGKSLKESYSPAFMKVHMVSGAINVSIYAVAVRYSYEYFGLVYGTLISFGISLVSAYFVYLFVNKKMN